jgi:hypothetical protein
MLTVSGLFRRPNATTAGGGRCGPFAIYEFDQSTLDFDYCGAKTWEQKQRIDLDIATSVVGKSDVLKKAFARSKLGPNSV